MNSRSGRLAEEIAEHNQGRREAALLVLDRLIRERLASGEPGTVGVRIAFSHGKLGPIWRISEDKLT